ncbi:MAG TPA: hypothetical protein VFV35_02675, partial [Acidimicrobiales bacterium]|nr:hypothetical protein [Acidimicrobiales bacterium]
MTTARVGVADPRFLLPSFPSTVTALEPAWARALEVLGVEQADRPDLVVCGPSEVEAALAIDPPAVIVEGGSRAARRALERAGHRTSTWMALGAATTEALIPLHAPRVARHAIARWRPPASRLRRTVGLAAVTAGIELPGRRTVLVGSRDRRPPAVVRAAVDAAGLRATSEMFLGVPGVEVTSRLAAMIFDEGATEPAVVVKFLRRANAPATAFDEDERGLALAARFPVVASRAPSLLARLDIAGHPASVETAALGTPMGRSLASGSAGARHAIDAVAAWLVEVGSATASGTAETAWRALA